jgi:hypothetical protein
MGPAFSEPAFLNVPHGNLRAKGNELVGNGFADARRAAGHQNNSIVEEARSRTIRLMMQALILS